MKRAIDTTPPTPARQAGRELADGPAPFDGVVTSIPDAGQLPLPTQEELEETHAAAREVLSVLMAAAIPATTQRALRGVLRYWALWHRAYAGTELPLLREPPEPVPGDTVLVFIAHHAPVKSRDSDGGSSIQTGMPEYVRGRLARLQALEGARGKRQVAARAAASIRRGEGLHVAEDVPALKTVQQRVSLLGTLHTMRRLRPPQETDGRIRPMMAALGAAVRNTMQVALPRAKQAIEVEELQRMLDACHPLGTEATLEGKRDQALLLAAFSSGRRRSEVAAMCQEHLRFGQMELPDGGIVQGYWWDLYALKGVVADAQDAPVLTVPIVGAAAEALDAWLDVLRAEGLRDGPVWRTIRKVRTKAAREGSGPAQAFGVPIKPELVATIVKRRASEALVAERPELQGEDADVVAERQRLVAERTARWAAHSLRSGFATSQIKAGVAAYDVMKLTGHKSIASFRRYDQSGNANNPALAQLMAFRL